MDTVTVRSAKQADKPQLDSLMQQYLMEFSSFEANLRPDDSGRFVYPYLDAYWQDPNRYPFLLKLQEETVGFALCRYDIDPANGQQYMELAEFFVLSKWRRNKIGESAASKLWELFPGYWEIRVMAENKGAIPFWQSTIDGYTKSKFSEKSIQELRASWIVFRFESASDFDMPDDFEPDIVDY